LIADLCALRTKLFEYRADECTFPADLFALLPAGCRIIAGFGCFGDFLQISYTFFCVLELDEFLILLRRTNL
jgi:hypothetical protein